MSLVGTNVEMVGGRAKVSGAVSYVADMEFPGLLYAKVLRSPYPHAKLLRIDGSKAAALSGVRAVLTRDDLAGLNPYFGTGVEDQPVLVIDKVRCVGDIVAAVAADSKEIAEEAVSLIEADYEELPAATDLLEAATPGAPIIHEQQDSPGRHRQQNGQDHQMLKESVHQSSFPSTWSVPVRPREASRTTRNSAVMAKPITMAVNTRACGTGSV